MNDTEDPAATETVAVLVPFSPPTLHRRSSLVRSRGWLVIGEEQKLKSILGRYGVVTGYWGVVVCIFANISVGCFRHSVSREHLEDVCVRD